MPSRMRRRGSYRAKGSDVVDWLTLGVTVLGLGGLLVQIRAATRGQQIDHDRQRCQATLDAWNATLEWRGSLWAQLPNDRDLDSVRAFCPDARDTSDPRFQLVVDYLNYLENLSVGVKHGVYDIEVLNSLAGSRIVAAWRGYSGFIADRREVLSAPTLWIELEGLAAALRAL